MNQLDINPILECTHSTYFLREDGILEMQLKADYFFTIKEAKEITENIVFISQNKPHKLLLIAEEHAYSDYETIQYSVTKDSTDPLLALAIVTNSLAQILLANFIIKIVNPAIPAKLFRKKEDAEKWLLNVI